MEIIDKKYVKLDLDIKSRNDLFEQISNDALKNKIVDNVSNLVSAFNARETLDSTAFDDGFAIPHARFNGVLKPACYFVRFKNPIIWDDHTKKQVDAAIMLIVPEKANDDYLDILSNIAQKLMNKEIRDVLKKSKKQEEIIEILKKQKEQKTSVISKQKNALKVVGVSACATGVAHTYMARDAILEAGEKLNWTVAVETQGQKGVEFSLTQKEIDDADAVILAVDIAVDVDRFAGKKIYKVGTKTLLDDPETQLRYAISKGKIIQVQGGSSVFDTKQNNAWVQHIMSGVSYMIPFIVFAGIIFAVVTGLGKIIYGTWLDYSGNFADGIYTQSGINDQLKNSHNFVNNLIWNFADGSWTVTIHSYTIGIFYYLNKFANIGFSVMIPVMGAYIANSIAGRAAIAPAFVLTMLGTTPDNWMKYGKFESMSKNFPSNGGGIFAAVLFGFLVGYTVKWINTRWKINRYIQPIMPIIIIPVFVSLIYGLITLLIIGNIFGILIGYLNVGLQKLEGNSIGMPILGLILGLLAGVDMGGPINKIASFGATALIFTDGGKAMGTAAAAFAVAPMGAGISTFIFKKRFADDKALGINATILGFMGISEGAIPFAVKYRWAAIIPNIIGSGIAAMFAGIFQVSGWVGAWGGPIIAIFGGVTTWGMSYIGILWYFIAIALGICVHIVIFRSLVYVQDNSIKPESVKETHLNIVKNHKKEFATKNDQLINLKLQKENEKSLKIRDAKIAHAPVDSIKNEYKNIISNINNDIKENKNNYANNLKKYKLIYKEISAKEKIEILNHANDIKEFKINWKADFKQKKMNKSELPEISLTDSVNDYTIQFREPFKKEYLNKIS